jgi:double-strand break repair protein MRE11
MGDNFRMTANPLSKVRGFAMGEVSLIDFDELNPEDPKIDDKVTKVLVAKVKELINEARERTEVANEAAETHRQNCGMEDEDLQPEYDLNIPQRVLVRLKVEHTGFSTLNNQR